MKSEHSPETEILQSVDAIAHPLVLTSLLALSTFPEGHYVPPRQVVQRVGEIAEPTRVSEIQSKFIVQACRVSLQAAGLVDFAPRNETTKTPLQVRLNQKGWSIGLAAAGSLLELELSRQAGSLRVLMGPLEQVSPHNPRPGLYEELVKGPLSLASARRLCYSRTSAPRLFAELQDNGIIHEPLTKSPQATLYRLDWRKYDLPSNMRPEVKVALNAIEALHESNGNIVNGAQILERARSIRERIPSELVWQEFKKWHRRAVRLGYSHIIEDSSPRDAAASTIKLTDEYRPLAQRLLSLRRAVSGTSEKAEAFREATRKRALIISQSSRLVGSLLAESQLDLDPHQDWADILAEMVPIQGIEMTELQQQIAEMTGINVTLNNLQQYIANTQSLRVARWPGAKSSDAPHDRVLYERMTFPSSWRDNAVCKDDDPELFFPIGTGRLAARQAERAKEACEICPVRFPCLRHGVSLGDGHVDQKATKGVHGGVWLDNRREVPVHLNRVVNDTIIIE